MDIIKRRARSKRWADKHPEQKLAAVRAWRLANPEKARAACRAWQMSDAGRHCRRMYTARIKAAVMRLFGGRCEVCGESDWSRLCLDHVNRDGSKGRKYNGESGRYLYQRLLNGQVDRSRFRLLCFGCNGQLEFSGFLPHQAASILYHQEVP